jgi:hypothetical protein
MHPKDSVSHGLWKERWGGVPNFIKEHVNANFQYSEPLSTCLVWKIARTPLPFIDRKQPPLKTIFISILQMKSSSTC